MEDKVLMKLRDTVENDIEQLVATKSSLTPTEIENAKNAVCLIKEIDETIRGGKVEYKYETSEGMGHAYHSYPGYSYGWYDPYMHGDYSYGDRGGRMYSYGDEYDRTHSMARGRSATTGRFVSRGDDRAWMRDRDMDMSGRRMHGSFSYDSGMSGHSIEDRIIEKLEEMMDNAKSDYERMKINQIIRVTDSMKGE